MQLSGSEKNDGYGSQTWNISRGVLASEHKTACNTTNSAQPGERCTAESPLPLSTDIVCLVCHTSRYVGIDSRDGYENAKVFDSSVTGESHDG